MVLRLLLSLFWIQSIVPSGQALETSLRDSKAILKGEIMSVSKIHGIDSQHELIVRVSESIGLSPTETLNGNIFRLKFNGEEDNTYVKLIPGQQSLFFVNYEKNFYHVKDLKDSWFVFKRVGRQEVLYNPMSKESYSLRQFDTFTTRYFRDTLTPFRIDNLSDGAIKKDKANKSHSRSPASIKEKGPYRKESPFSDQYDLVWSLVVLASLAIISKRLIGQQ